MNLLSTTNKSGKTGIYYVIISAAIIIHAILTFLPVTASKHYLFYGRTWGFNHIKYYSSAYIILFYMLIGLTTVPYINQKIFQLFEYVSVLLKKIRKIKVVLFFLTGILAAVLFYIFRNKYFLLGDFNLRVNQTMKQEFLTTEYLTMRTLYMAATFLGKYQINPVNAFVIISCATGGVFVIVNCFIADLLGKTSLQKNLLFTGSVISGMLLIFCGYLDIYALPLLFISFYLFTALLYINHKNYFWLAFLCLILAIGFHLLCVAFAPSLFIAWYSHHKAKLSGIAGKSNKTKLYTILILSVAAIIMAYKLHVSFLLPTVAPRNNPKYLTLFSWAHIWEFINGQLLACGASFVFYFVLIYKVIKQKIVLTTPVYFFLTASGSTMLLIFLSNLHRGSGDWDIMSFTAITLNTTVILLFFATQNNSIKLTNYLIVWLICYNSLNAFLWIHINSTDKSMQKVEDMLVTDPGTYYTSKLPGIVQLLFIYQENKLDDEVERISLKACKMLDYKDLRPCLVYAKALVTKNKHTEAVAFYEEVINKNPIVPDAYPFLLYEYQNKNQTEKMLMTVSKFYNAFRVQPNIFVTRLGIPECINLIEYWYNYNKMNKMNANYQEMTNFILQLKQAEKNKPLKK